MSAVCYLCHNEAGEVTAVIRGDSNHMDEPTGSFIKYTGTEEVSTKWYIKDGVAKEKGEPPSKSHVFNVVSESWELDLADGKSRAWDRIKLSKQGDEFSTFTWSGNEFQCDESSQNKIRGAVMRALIDSTISITWTLADNSAETFNATQLREIGKALEEHVNDCHVKAQGLRTQINAATDQAQLDAVSW